MQEDETRQDDAEVKHEETGEKDEFFDPAPQPRQPQEQKTPKSRRIVSILLALALLAVGFLCGWLTHYYSVDPDIRSFLWALQTTEKYYYKDIDEDAIYAAADSSAGGKGLIEALNAALDDYSCFYTAEEYDAVLASGAGQKQGIGIALYNVELDGTEVPRVLLVVENSPAQAAGICKGMYLTAFGTEESTLRTGNSTELIGFVSEQDGTFVLRAGYSADGSDGQLVEVQRKSYQAAYCYYRDSETSYSFRGDGSSLSLTETFSPIEGLDDSTAYIRIDEFSGNAASEFTQCLNTMKLRKRSNLILDLRTNGGGYLSILQSIASHFCKNSEESYPVVATAHYKSGKVTTYSATSKNDYYSYFTEDSEIRLLADENTASASECLIGSMVDYGALSYDHIWVREYEVVGENGTDVSFEAATYGKGIMQSYYTGLVGTMKLTVATIHWPVSGNCIHGVGVTKEAGANAVRCDLVWTETEDPMLEAVLSAGSVAEGGVAA